MPRFFVDQAFGDTISVTGDDARHIGKSLRMRAGEELTVCDGCGTDCDCVIDEIYDDEVVLRVVDRHPGESEADVRVTLYQGYPKGDKLETVIEKAVELGAYSIVPVLTERSVARPDAKSAEKKLLRWQRHALEAAKQCGRSIIPQVEELLPFDKLPERMRRHELCIFCYELGGESLRALIASHPAKDIALFIGPEGGISKAEADALTQAGAYPATLGRRILRTETAPIAAIAAIMLATGNLE